MSNLFFADDILFDSHCHLNDSSFEIDRGQAVEAAVAAGVERMIDVATDLATTKAAIENAKKFPGVVFAAAGIDPDIFIPGSNQYVPGREPEAVYRELDVIAVLARENKELVLAIVETGIDAYWLGKKVAAGELPPEESGASLFLQEQLFRRHLELAEELDLPLTVHSRAAEERCVEIAAEYPAARGVFHSYTGSYETAKRVLALGWGLGLNGIFTYPNGENVREVFLKVLGKPASDWSPADLYARGVYLETDAPYLTPRGAEGRNQPANIRKIWERVLQA